MTAVVTQVRGFALHARMSSPELLNSLDEELVEGLNGALERVEQDRSLRVLVIEGSPEVFSVGLGPSSRDRLRADPAALAAFISSFNLLLDRLDAAPVPVVAVASGTVRAGGFELVLACDLLLVADEARVSDNHLASNAIPGGGASVRAMTKLGHQQAHHLILTSRWLSGPEAVQCGLALLSVPAAELDARAEALVAELCASDRDALEAAKAQLRAARDLPYAAALTQAAVVFADHMRGR